MGCHFLLQGIFPTQGSNLSYHLLHWNADSLPSESPDSFLKKLRPIHMSWHETPTTCDKIKTRILVSDHTPYPAAAAAKSLQLCPTLCDSIDAHQDPLYLGSSRQEYWSGLPFPSPLHACMLSRFSHVLLFEILWTANHQAPLSMGFSRQKYWSGLPFPSPGDIPDSGIKPLSPASPALAAGFFTTSNTWEAHLYIYIHMYGERVNRYGQALSHLAK